MKFGQATLAQPLPTIDAKDVGDAAKQVETRDHRIQQGARLASRPARTRGRPRSIRKPPRRPRGRASRRIRTPRSRASACCRRSCAHEGPRRIRSSKSRTRSRRRIRTSMLALTRTSPTRTWRRATRRSRSRRTSAIYRRRSDQHGARPSIVRSSRTPARRTGDSDHRLRCS